MDDSVPDPTSTAPFPLERGTTPAPQRRRSEVPAAPREGFVFSPVSFVLGLLLGVTLTSCVSGAGLVLMYLFA